MPIPDPTPEPRVVNRYPISPALQKRLENAFTYHPLKHGQEDRYHAIRQEGLFLALRIVQSTPEGREQALALTHLEQAVMWANAAIARGE
jgi:hypothetical protein